MSGSATCALYSASRPEMNSPVITSRAALVVALIFLALGVAVGIQWNEEIKHRAAMRKATTVPCIEVPRVITRAD